MIPNNIPPFSAEQINLMLFCNVLDVYQKNQLKKRSDKKIDMPEVNISSGKASVTIVNGVVGSEGRSEFQRKFKEAEPPSKIFRL